MRFFFLIVYGGDPTPIATSPPSFIELSILFFFLVLFAGFAFIFFFFFPFLSLPFFFFFFACVHVCFVFCVCVSGLASRFIHLLFLSFYGLRVRVAVAAGASFFPCCVFRSRRLQDGRRGMRLLQSRPLFPRFSFPLTQCDPTRHDACPVSHAFLQELFHEKERVSPQQTTTNKKMSK